MGPGQTVAHAVADKEVDALLLVELDDALLHLLLGLERRRQHQLHLLTAADELEQGAHALADIGEGQKRHLDAGAVHGQLQAAQDVIGGKADIDNGDPAVEHRLRHRRRLAAADDHVVGGQRRVPEERFDPVQRKHLNIQVEDAELPVVPYHILNNAGKALVRRDHKRPVFLLHLCAPCSGKCCLLEYSTFFVNCKQSIRAGRSTVPGLFILFP